VPRILAALVLVAALGACTGEANDPLPTQASTPDSVRPTATGPVCPAPKPADAKWPKDLPDLPLPAGLEVARVNRSSGNIVQVRGPVPMSLRDSVLFIVHEYPKAGFTLGRGDAEATEADAPFQRGEGLRGLVRVFYNPTNECETLWVFAVVQDTSAPYNLSYTPPPSSTPLPFG
jgi:hypothetical protein